ncbi:uncharacterized protein LOC132790425 isoform X1 [Drosophila nasuta]|uniref:uncharacterized protein LOC132790425 isoform X1 n=1 Tax=Drosophila nasuta TaxID=42062 RepID=UPI00295E2914|nr:uncharacterized protein LOC132790425 isoform X1 [Drosophila nasuta]
MTSLSRLTTLSQANVATSHHRTIRIHEHKKWKRILEQAYPLPPAPPEMCRDAFLEELLKPYESESYSKTIDTEDSILNKVQFGEITELGGNYFNAEEKLLNIRVLFGDKLKRSSISAKDSVATDSLPYGPDLNKLMKERYGNIASAIGYFAVIFQLQTLKHRMNMFKERWRMDLSIDKELRLFGWSIKDYLQRFSQPNLVYLDTVERLLGKQIECFKFRMDLKEINRLIDCVIDDVRTKRNICNGSMVLIKDAEMDIEVLLTNSQKEATEEHAKVAKAAANMPRSADPFGRRAKAIYSKINHFDFVYPIEARYRINWTQTTMEQSILKVDFDEKRLSDELNGIKQQIEEVRSLWKISSVAYNAQIYSLKNSIMDRELQYEENLELAESQIQMTRLRLGKAKDDLKYYKEQIPMFHRKIAEVQKILALQELENRKSSRASRKSSRKSSGAKLLMKAKK